MAADNPLARFLLALWGLLSVAIVRIYIPSSLWGLFCGIGCLCREYVLQKQRGFAEVLTEVTGARYC